MGGRTGREVLWLRAFCACRNNPAVEGCCFFLGKKDELILGMADPKAPKWRHTRESCGPIEPEKEVK